MTGNRGARLFSDSAGQTVAHDGASPISWRMSVYGLVVRDGRVLMKQHPRIDRWELPGGAAEPHETLTEAVERECWEETGFRIAVTEPDPVHVEELFFYHRGNATYHNSIVMVFRGMVDTEPAATWVPNAREARRIDWVDPTMLTSRTTQRFHWAALQKACILKEGAR